MDGSGNYKDKREAWLRSRIRKGPNIYYSDGSIESKNKPTRYSKIVSPATKVVSNDAIHVKTPEARKAEEMSTFDLLSSPAVLMNSLKYMNNLTMSLSPSVTSEEKTNKSNHLKKFGKSKKAAFYKKESKLKAMKTFVESCKRTSSLMDMNANAGDLIPMSKKQRGNPSPIIQPQSMVEELMKRCKENHQSSGSSGDVIGDMSGFFPNYVQNEKEYSQHCRVIKDMSFAAFEDHIHGIQGDLVKIYKGEKDCARHEIFSKGPTSSRIRKLKEMAVSVPFSGLQGTLLISNLYKLAYPDGLTEDVSHCANYVSLVLMPEAYIRVYARANKMSYEKAEKEMQCGPCY